MKHVILATALLVSTAAFAQDHSAHAGHGTGHEGHHMMSRHVQTDTSESTKEFMKANEVMHYGMDIKFSGDTDIDFLEGMIPHHQGAVDMAQTLLRYGEDSQVKRLARDIIRAQEREIQWMKNKLAQLKKKERGWFDKIWLGEHDIQGIQ